MKFIALSLAFVFSAVAADPNVGEYVHRDEAISVIIEFWAREPHPSQKGERVRLPLKIERDDRFTSAVNFLVRTGYARAQEEAKKKNLEFPDIRIMGTTAVARGEEQKIVAKSGRRFDWPSEFQLQNGDVIRVFEYFF